MKKMLILTLFTSGLFLNAQVKVDDPFTKLFVNMGMSATHTVEKYQDGSIYIMFQNLEYSTISDIEMAQYIYEFSLNGNKFYNGKLLQVSNSTP